MFLKGKNHIIITIIKLSSLYHNRSGTPYVSGTPGAPSCIDSALLTPTPPGQVATVPILQVKKLEVRGIKLHARMFHAKQSGVAVKTAQVSEPHRQTRVQILALPSPAVES